MLNIKCLLIFRHLPRIKIEMISIEEISTKTENEAALLVKTNLFTLAERRLIRRNMLRKKTLVVYFLAILVQLVLTSFSLVITLAGFGLLFTGHVILLLFFARQANNKVYPDLCPGPFYSYWKREPHLRRLWVAVDGDGKVVGTIGMKQISDNTAEICRMSVSKDLRRQGIGSRLIGHVAHYCKSQGYKTLQLHTLDDYHEARSLYQKEGFHAVKTFFDTETFLVEILVVNMIKKL